VARCGDGDVGRAFTARQDVGRAFTARHGPRDVDRQSERGVALVLAVMAMTLLLTLGGALVILITTESTIAARFRDGLEAFYAAEAGIARAIVDLRTADWDAARAGLARSSFADEAFDLAVAERDILEIDRGLAWQPYAYGRFHEMLPGANADSRLSVVVWVAADPDGDENQVVVRSHAYGPSGVRRMIEARVQRTVDGLRVIEWREGS
jgi:hypothetical protein